MIDRSLDSIIRTNCYKGKAIIIIGARQIGKSTLIKQIFGQENDVLWLNGDDFDVRQMFDSVSSTRLKAIIGNNKVVIVDEAQRIENIGLKLKLITDQIPNVQLIATGSSSFDLNNKLSESLAGRKRVFKMFPISFVEMKDHTSLLEELRMIPHRMVYGYYPEVVCNPGSEREILNELTDSYLYKDCLAFDFVKKSDKIVNLAKALAMQIGNQISYSELGQIVGLDSKTTEKYINILEQCYIVFRLGSYAKNLRNELKSSKKIYFWDLGIRNAIIGNFKEIENRTDFGEMWENFAIVERLKMLNYKQSFSQPYYWRTKQQQEIDYIEELDGQLSTFEFKWNPNKANVKQPSSFLDAYPNSSFKVITPQNIEEFLLF